MRVGVHPMVVAVALGLLGPSALPESEREPDCDGAGARPAQPCGAACTCFEADDASDADAVEAALAEMVRG